MNEFTDWYPFSIKPIYAGAYQVYKPLFPKLVMHYWDGEHWPEFPRKENFGITDAYWKWRGLTEGQS